MNRLLRTITLQKIIWVVIGLALLWGAWRAISLAWVGDDAFISFRYARNLVEGHGLVYNIGEVVEGYTNFLWTVLIAGGMLIGLEPVGVSQVLGILSYLATAVILISISQKLWRNLGEESSVFVPLAAAAFLVHRDAHVYATSGLETAMTTMLVTLGFGLLVLGQQKRTFLLAGLVLVLAVLSRPDAMIFFLMGAVFVALAQNRRWSSLGWYLLPALIIYAPYWLWRFDYYGYPFPNTYYAKSAYLSWYSQGIKYVWLYFKTYYVLWLFPIALVPLAITSIRTFAGKWSVDNLVGRIGLAGILFSIPFVTYVARVGGDFMFARFLIPITPIMFVLLEAALTRFAGRIRIAVVISVVLVTGVLLRWDQFPGEVDRIGGIADEIKFYPDSWVEKSRKDGSNLKRYLGDSDVAVGFLGTRAMLMFFSDLPRAVECAAGLTDEYIAHQPIEVRGHPGHEKHASLEYLTERGVRFMFFREPPFYGRYDPFRQIKFGDLGAIIVAWDNDLMTHLGQFPEITFTDFPGFLDWYLANIETIPVTQRMEDFDFFRQFYFDHNQDEPRLRMLVERLQS